MKRTLIILTLLCLLIQAPALKAQNKNNDLLKRKLNIPSLTFNFNPVGFGLYGPIAQFEIKLQNPVALVPWVRYSYAGALSNYLWTNFEDDQEYSPASIAVGLGLKKFISARPKKNMVYYGGAVEFIHEEGLHNTYDPRYEYEQIRNAIAVYGNLGYRWNSRKAFYVSLGILPGVAIDIKNKGYYTSGASEGLEYDDYSRTTFIGMMDFSLGWRLKRGY